MQMNLILAKSYANNRHCISYKESIVCSLTKIKVVATLNKFIIKLGLTIP